MIDIIDEKYGRVIIIDREDNPTGFDEYLFNYRNDIIPSHTFLLPIRKIIYAMLIVLRDREKNEIEIIKSRWSKDIFTKKFLMNYGLKEEEIFEPINSRFEILDI